MNEFVVTVDTGAPAMPGLGPDPDEEDRFLRNHPNISLDGRDDGSVVATVRLQAEDASQAEDEGRQLVEDVMQATGRAVLPENFSSTVTTS
jgi:hypothetical protein